MPTPEQRLMELEKKKSKLEVSQDYLEKEMGELTKQAKKITGKKTIDATIAELKKKINTQSALFEKEYNKVDKILKEIEDES